MQAASVPYSGPHLERPDPLPARGFDVRGMGWLPPSSDSGPDQRLLLPELANFVATLALGSSVSRPQ